MQKGGYVISKQDYYLFTLVVSFYPEEDWAPQKENATNTVKQQSPA